jgi:uncharacterized protein YqjF (DUF2071 family)
VVSHPAFEMTDHRPWPLPKKPWTWRQSWCDLLFAHWPIPADQLRAVVPSSLTLQQFDRTAWVGVVPFRMEGVMRRPLPDLPWLSAFPEMNVRTYVERDGKPGVWFFSLDASNGLAVWAAKRFFHLPYFKAAMTVVRRGDTIEYVSRRASSDATFEAQYAPDGPPYRSTPGTLEHWLTERYCLYAESPDRRIFRAEVHHRPWPLQRARADIRRNTMLSSQGVHISDSAPLLHFATRLDVVVWSPERV